MSGNSSWRPINKISVTIHCWNGRDFWPFCPPKLQLAPGASHPKTRAYLTRQKSNFSLNRRLGISEFLSDLLVNSNWTNFTSKKRPPLQEGWLSCFFRIWARALSKSDRLSGSFLWLLISSSPGLLRCQPTTK